MKKQQYLRCTPFFWSRLGFNYDPPRYGKDGNLIVFSREYHKYRRFHEDFQEAGVRYHTTILNSGWVDDKTYDYSLTDETLDALLKDNPDMLYMPRVKLNAPTGWCKKYPEEVFVYEKYRHLTSQEISSICGTLEHDWFGFNCEGYIQNGAIGVFHDDRPNFNGKVGLQSFSSKKWEADASEALIKLIEHIQKGRYAKQVIGYHIAYGQLGETGLWGGWRDRKENHRGDFSRKNRQAFIEYGLQRYGTQDKLLKKWGCKSVDDIQVPSIAVRDLAKPCLRELFYDEAHNLICLNYDEFMSDINAKACEAFCKVVKDKTRGEAAAGIFYGYIYSPQSAYMGHCGLDRILHSPYIDFIAAPKGYFRSRVGEPGGEQGPSYSINKKKVWLDEIDNLTHLDKREGRAKNLFETRTLILREGLKNLSSNQGFWWMDLGEGWYDAPEVMSLIGELSEVQDKICQKQHKSISEIMVVVDEKSLMSMSFSYGLTGGLLFNLQSEIRLIGAPVDTLRLEDLYDTDISQYKLIVFSNTFKIDKKMREILKVNAKGKIYIWNYTAGILSPDFSVENVQNLTGLSIREFESSFKTESFGYKLSPYKYWQIPEMVIDFPTVEILQDGQQEVLSRYPDGRIMCAKTTKDGGKSVLCAFPSMQAIDFRELALEAGCKLYAPIDCTVYADNRILGVFPKNDVSFNLNFGDFKANGFASAEVSIKSNGAEYFIFD